MFLNLHLFFFLILTLILLTSPLCDYTGGADVLTTNTIIKYYANLIKFCKVKNFAGNIKISMI